MAAADPTSSEFPSAFRSKLAPRLSRGWSGFFMRHRLCSEICHAHLAWPSILAEPNISYMPQTTFHESSRMHWLMEHNILSVSILRDRKDLVMGLLYAVILTGLTFSPHLVTKNIIYHADAGCAFSHLGWDSASGFFGVESHYKCIVVLQVSVPHRSNKN